MVYLHVIDTYSSDYNVKSMFVEEVDSYRLGKLISLTEVDNIVIVNSIEKDLKNPSKRIMTIMHIFLNGKEDLEYLKELRINKKNT